MTGWDRALIASARVWLPTILAVAITQTLLVLADPVPVASPATVILALASGSAFALGLWLVSRALGLAVDDQPVRWRTVLTAHPALLWAIVVVVLLVLLALLSPYLTLLGLWFGLLGMPAVSAGASNPFAAAAETIRRAPVRVILGALAVAVAWALCAIGMLLLGFLVTGPLSVALTWLAVGVVGTVFLAGWTALYRRARITA